MTKEHLTNEEKKGNIKPPKTKEAQEQVADTGADISSLAHLQNQMGNQAVQRLLAQRSGGDKPFELDEETTQQISQARGSGEPLAEDVKEQMSSTLGQDFSGVRVHTSPEADSLNQQLNAKAFTTGQDIFFKEGAYQPNSSGGQELIAHELTHVVQQSSGAVSDSGSGMTVNAPGDRFEQEADAVAKAAGQPGTSTEVQRQTLDEEEEIGPDTLEPDLEEEEEIV